MTGSRDMGKNLHKVPQIFFPIRDSKDLFSLLYPYGALTSCKKKIGKKLLDSL